MRIQEGFLYDLVALIIAISIHEFAHAISADSLGDGTARSQGRVTLNPLAHFDPFGFVMLCLLAALGTGFAWGRPVPVNTYFLRGGRRGFALVAFAGPLSNLIQAAVGVAAVRFLFANESGDTPLMQFLFAYVSANISLAAFNMLPVPPLDGYNILLGVVSNFWVQRLEPLREKGPALLLLLVFFGPYIGFYGYTVRPLEGLFARLVGAA